MIAAESVDVVIATFQRAGPVVDAVASALTQTHPVNRVIVVDDGSTDHTAEVLARLATDDRVLTIAQPNAGPSTARNRGIAASDADHVAFCDSDDLMAPDRIEWQLAHLAARPDCDAVMGLEEIRVADGVTPPTTITQALATGGPHWSFPSIFTRRSLLEDLGGFDEDLRIGEDVDLYLRMAGRGLRVDLVERTAVIRRILGDNLTYENVDGQRTLLRLLRRNIASRQPPGTGGPGPVGGPGDPGPSR